MIQSERASTHIPEGKELRIIEDARGKQIMYVREATNEEQLLIRMYQIIVSQEGVKTYVEVEKPNLEFSQDNQTNAESQKSQLVLARS